jgi:hypothetical protein
MVLKLVRLFLAGCEEKVHPSNYHGPDPHGGNMYGKLFGIRIVALIGAALITAFGVSPYDFAYLAGLLAS